MLFDTSGNIVAFYLALASGLLSTLATLASIFIYIKVTELRSAARTMLLFLNISDLIQSLFFVSAVRPDPDDALVCRIQVGSFFPFAYAQMNAAQRTVRSENKLTKHEDVLWHLWFAYKLRLDHGNVAFCFCESYRQHEGMCSISDTG
jgi:hypothetical protein